MNFGDLTRMISLAVIWGASFLFLKIGAPVLGPILLIEYRVAFGATFLLAASLLLKKPLNLKENWKHYFLLGFFNCAFPFLLYAFAAKTLSASILSVMHATCPIWTAVIAAIWLRQTLPSRSIMGMFLGIVGVGILVGFDKISIQPGAGWAIVAMLLGAFSFGIAVTYAKSTRSISPYANAHGSLWAATILIAPAIPFFPATASPTVSVMAAVILLGVLCSGIAYLLYFRLVQDIGPTSTLTVTYLIPIFGIFWGSLFLQEVIGWHTVAGSLFAILGTALVTDYFPHLKIFQKAKLSG